MASRQNITHSFINTDFKTGSALCKIQGTDCSVLALQNCLRESQTNADTTFPGILPPVKAFKEVREVFFGKTGTSIPYSNLCIEGILLIRAVDTFPWRCMFHTVLKQVHNRLHSPFHIRPYGDLSGLRDLNGNLRLGKQFL